MQSPARPGDNLHDDIAFILGGDADLVVDVGCQHGDTTIGYLERFPASRAYAFEAEDDNHAHSSRNLARFGDRVRLFHQAVSDIDGELTFNVNSHYGTHSTLEIGEQRYWAGHVERVESRQVRSVRLDDVLAGESVDLLHMDIQGGELSALRGAERLLTERRVKLVYLEVEIYPLYAGQPLFWDIGQYLDTFGYKFYSLYDRYYHANNPRVLSWSDALFISPDLIQLPEHPAA